MTQKRHFHIANTVISGLLLGALVTPAATATGDTPPAGNVERPGTYSPERSAPFPVVGKSLVVPDQSLCPPTVQNQMQASGAWVAFDEKKAYKGMEQRTYFLPELTWTPILASGGKPTFQRNITFKPDHNAARWQFLENQWLCRVRNSVELDGYGDKRAPQERVTVFVAHRTPAPPQAGVVVIERENYCTDDQCTVRFANKTYNLRDVNVRRQLACRNYPSGNPVMPTSVFPDPFYPDWVERNDPYENNYEGPLFMMGAPWSEDPDLSSFAMSLGDKDICLPVPNKPGTYPFEITRKSRTWTTPGSPASWRCRISGSTVSCSYYGPTSDTSYNTSYKLTFQMEVKKNNVSVLPVKCQGFCVNQDWVAR